MHLFHFSADKNFHFVGGVFRLQDEGVFFFDYALKGGIISVHGNHGDVPAIYIVLLADEKQIAGVDADICHAVTLGA